MTEGDNGGICSGLRVLDLTRGIAGPMTAMLLADHGADLVRVEPPGGDGHGHLPGYAVWNRGKRLVHLDLTDSFHYDRFLELAAAADVLVESYRPGVTTRLGIDAATLRASNPALVYASITGYGRDNRHADRPGIEWLVTARTGMNWDQRGYLGTRMEHVMGIDATEPSFTAPPGAEQTGCREGPIFLAVPWASIGAALLAATGINAALFVRERTGHGQLVETSLLQAALMENAMGWQRVTTMHPSYRLWYFDRRAPKGIFRTHDDRWLHQWAPFEHSFIRESAAGAMQGSAAASDASGRPLINISPDYESQVEWESAAYVETARAIATLPLDDWVQRFAAANRAAQPIRSPEEALQDEALAREGSVVELDDPHRGRIRQVGHVYGFEKVPNPAIRSRPASPSPIDEVLASWHKRPAAARTGERPQPAAPLTGVVVLDFGLAIAGPYGPQVLADLGATVIKVTTLDSSLTDAIYVGSSHGKQALAVDLKHPRGREIAERLIRNADVVHHNMRTGVAERLGIGYEQARALNPRIIYCHTRGFERDGPRTNLPGNDQTGNALAGTEYEAGGTHHGTPPIWHTIAFGDTGNGVLSANAVVQALRHRDLTGEGQFVHTSILNVCMLFNSYTFAYSDGSGPERERIDSEQYGFSALRRLYATATEWICIYVCDDDQWTSCCTALGRDDLAADPRFVSAISRHEHDEELAAELAKVLAAGTAEYWIDRLDTRNVPCEIASATFAAEAFDDTELRRRGWVITNDHSHLGTVDQTGMPFSFSATPGQNLAGAPITGQHSRQILTRVGYTNDEVDRLVADNVIVEGETLATPTA